MTVNLHEQVLTLLLEKDPAEVSPEERMAAESHLHDCLECAAKCTARELAMQDLRALSGDVIASRELVRTTQMQLRLYAAERRQMQERMSPVWMTAGLAGVWAVGSIPFLWSGFEWMGQAAQLPSFVWQTAAVFAWITPTGLLAAVAAGRRESAFTE